MRTADTTRAVARLDYSNTFARTPDVPPPVLRYRAVLGPPRAAHAARGRGIDRVSFGSDYPCLRRDLAVASRERIEASAELSAGERAAVLGATAAKLIPRLAT